MKRILFLSYILFVAAAGIEAQAVSSVSITNAGVQTCNSSPLVDFSNGSGSGASGYAQLFAIPNSSNYGVLAVILTNGGSGYRGAFAVIFTGVCTTVAATATANVQGKLPSGQFSGNATTASGPAIVPTLCGSGMVSTGDLPNFEPGCISLTYAMLTGSVPIWNQNTLGNAATATTAGSAGAAPWSGLTGIPVSFPGNVTGNAATATALAASPTLCAAGQVATGINASGTPTCITLTGTLVWSSASTSLCTTSTCYMGVGYTGGNQHKGSFIAPRAGTVQACTAAVAAAVTGSNYYTATLLKNGTACSSGPVIVLNSGSDLVVTDSSHTCTVAQGDLLVWQLTVTGTIPSGDVGSASCLY